MRLGSIGAMLAASILLTGCAATQTALSHHDLSVQTKMTDSIFLDPVPPNEHTIFVQVRNTTDQPQFTIEGDLRDALVAKGYTVVADPSAAHYLLQVNVLSVGKANPSAAQKSFLGGYGSAIAGAAAGAAIGVVGGGSAGAGLAGGLLGGAASLLADSLVKDVTYAVITDVQISEKSGAAVSETSESHVKQGRTATKQQFVSESTHRKTWQTRVMSTADQVNLDFADAMPALEKGLTTSISGLF